MTDDGMREERLLLNRLIAAHAENGIYAGVWRAIPGWDVWVEDVTGRRASAHISAFSDIVPWIEAASARIKRETRGGETPGSEAAE